MLTPDDLLTMPEGNHYELVDGRLVERGVGSWAAFIAGQLLGTIGRYEFGRRQGILLGPGASYQCFASNNVRMPSLSFILAGRLLKNRVPEGHILIAPDLAVEVVRPNDIHYDIDRKVAEYLEAGVKLIWVINPNSKVVLIYRADGSISGVRDGDELDAEAAIPGFRCWVADLFIP